MARNDPGRVRPSRLPSPPLQPLVIDASALFEYLMRRPVAIERAIQKAGDLHAPALCDVEVASAIRHSLLQGRLKLVRASEALQDLLDLPLRRHWHELLLERVLSLRENFTAYDATYIALAEALGAQLLTADATLARAVRAHLELAIIEAF